MSYVENKTSQFEIVDNSVVRFNASHRNFEEMKSFGRLFTMNVKKTWQENHGTFWRQTQFQVLAGCKVE